MQDEKDVAKKKEAGDQAGSKDVKKTDGLKSKEQVDKKSIGDKIRDIKAEFDKIIWPSRQELIKQTVTVIFISLLFGGVVFVMDSVYGLGLSLLMQLFGKS